MNQEPTQYDEIINNLPPETMEVLVKILSRLDHRRDRSPWYKLKEAAPYMRCGVTKVRELIDAGLLKSYRLDQKVEKSTILIHKKDMDALILCGRSKGLQPREQKLLKFMQ